MKKKLITSALPYVNNIPHLGNLIQVLSADVFSRFCRLRGYDTLYVCGTDEYGTATETRALEEGKTPRDLCDYYNTIHRDIYRWFEIAFDNFGRTSTPQQTEVTQGIFKDLEAHGFIKEHTIEQLFCTSCNRFLADRYVRGTCPACNYEDARGDQCEHCGTLLDPTELKHPRCSSCSEPPQLRKTSHLYIDLPGILPLYEQWMKETSVRGQWARNAIQMTQAWIRDGLQERAITRDLQWGIPVPRKGYEHKVFYVWFDAPIGYISITKCLTDSIGGDWKLWWQNPDDVELFQFIGKDNIPFHTVIFPSSLLGSGRKWTTLHHMSSTEYLNYEAGKFSKSKGIGVFGSDAMESGIHADAWRFYIFYNRPEKSDSLFTWKDFQEKINSELVGNLGNLVNRTLTFVARYYDGSLPAVDGASSSRQDIREVSLFVRSQARKSFDRIQELLEWAELREAFREIFVLSSVANKAFQDGEPWKMRTQDSERAQALLHDLVYLIKDLTIVLHPYLPDFASQVAGWLGYRIWSGNIFDGTVRVAAEKPVGSLSWDDLGKRGTITTVATPEIIFRPLDNTATQTYRERYAGSQQERKDKEQHTLNTSHATQATAGSDGRSTGPTTEPQTEPQTVPEKPNVCADVLFNEKIALKAAKIIVVERHPDAEKLYIETLDDGSGTPRVIVSSLVPYYTAEQLLGKTIILADNLKPRKMRGVESRGMLLAAACTNKDGSEAIEVLDIPWAPPGTPVVLEGRHSTADKPQIIDADTFFAVPITVAGHQVGISGIRLMAAGTPVRSATISDGTVS